MAENKEIVDEIVEVCPFIANRILDYLENFLFSLKEFEDVYMQGHVLNYKELINDNGVEKWQKHYMEDVDKYVLENKSYLESMHEQIGQQNILEKKSLDEIARNEEEINILKEKISNIKKKNEHLRNFKDKVQICKLLTNTSFIYKGSNISGYVVEPVSKQMNYFELNPETLSKNEIINALYNTVKKVSCNKKQIE